MTGTQKAQKRKAHRYKKGDLVGVIFDCMADCRILYRLRKRTGKPLSYVATAERIYHHKPKTSFFGQNKRFVLSERSILVKLSK